MSFRDVDISSTVQNGLAIRFVGKYDTVEKTLTGVFQALYERNTAATFYIYDKRGILDPNSGFTVNGDKKFSFGDRNAGYSTVIFGRANDWKTISTPGHGYEEIKIARIPLFGEIKFSIGISDNGPRVYTLDYSESYDWSEDKPVVSPSSLVFDFARKIDDATGIGAAIHYYDGRAQELFIGERNRKNYLATIVLDLDKGKWEETHLIPQNGEKVPGTSDVYYGDTIVFSGNGIGETEKIAIDHASNGSVYFSTGNKIFRYHYAMDISPYLDSWDYTMQSDSPVNQFNAEIQNIETDIFSNDTTLFQPGARISVRIRIGESSPLSFGETWLDECSYDITGETISVSSRNDSGFFLKDQTLDEDHTYTGMTTTDVLYVLLRIGGITRCEVETNTDIKTWETKQSTNILDAVDNIISEYDGWAMLEDWDNKIYIGSEEWLFTHFPNGNFIFNETKDVFRRNTSRSSDSAYVKVVVSAAGSGNTSQPSVTKNVNHYRYWNLGEHKTKYITAPDGIKPSALNDFAIKKAKELQYIGIKDEMDLQLHPEVIVGDVAAVVSSENSSEATQLGLITEISHKFSKNEGWRTAIAVDSGGEYTAQGISMINRAAKAFGYNRKQNVIDIIRMLKDEGVIHQGSSGSGGTARQMASEEVGAKWIEYTT